MDYWREGFLINPGNIFLLVGVLMDSVLVSGIWMLKEVLKCLDSYLVGEIFLLYSSCTSGSFLEYFLINEILHGRMILSACKKYEIKAYASSKVHCWILCFSSKYLINSSTFTTLSISSNSFLTMIPYKWILFEVLSAFLSSGLLMAQLELSQTLGWF